jgi:hypothetical protein
MRNLIAVLAFSSVLASGVAAAQDDSPSISARPYWFVAPGALNLSLETLELGGGWEVVNREGSGGAVDFGYVGPIPDGFDYGVGLLSFDAIYHLRERGRSAAPFVAGGYTMTVLRGERGHLLNVGIGVERRLANDVIVRIEGRDHFLPGSRLHLFGVRLGVRWGR